MINPCVNCRELGVNYIKALTLVRIAHRYYKITLRNGNEIIVCAEHLENIRLDDVEKIEGCGISFINRFARTKRG